MKDLFVETFGDKAAKINCLDKGYVELLDCMPRCIEEAEESGDYVIAEAARCSYQRGTKTINDDKTLIRYLMRHNHTSPFEMIEFKFKVKMPIFVARQWIRHRMASVNELSGRYSEMPEEYYMPSDDNFRMQDTVNRQGSAGTVSDDVAGKMAEKMAACSDTDFAVYKELLNDGLVREQARITLPLSTYTEWYWKMDLKNLLHFLNLRCDSHAQLEMQVYGNAVLDLIRPLIPWTIDAWEEYSPYRGGMMLTKAEVEKLAELIKADGAKDNADAIKDITVSSGIEKREWLEKARRLGFEV